MKKSWKIYFVWFGHQTSDNIGFYKDVLKNQRKPIFLICFCFRQALRWSNIPWSRHSCLEFLLWRTTLAPNPYTTLENNIWGLCESENASKGFNSPVEFVWNFLTWPFWRPMIFWCLWQQFALLIKSLRSILYCFTIALGFFVFISPRMNLDLIYYKYTNLDLYIFILALYNVPSKKRCHRPYDRIQALIFCLLFRRTGCQSTHPGLGHGLNSPI